MSATGLVFLVAIAIGWLLAITRNPIYGLATYVGVYFVSPQSRWWGGGLPIDRWSLISALVLLVAVLVRKPVPHSIPLRSQKIVWGLLAFIIWLAIQSFWALDLESHLALLELFVKYLVLVALIYVTVQSEEHLRIFLWAQVLGGMYLGWFVYNSYLGGRFEGTGVPGANDANSAALLFATLTIVAASLFLAGSWKSKIVLLAVIPFILNSLVATVSRTGFLALGVGGVLYNVFTPLRYRKLVRGLSALAVVLFLLLANPLYWGRIETIKYAGEQVEGVDTAHSRIIVIKAQWEMFRKYPLGCGHRCTVVLSPLYIEDKYLTGSEGHRGRASHNTFMTLLVEQGVPGAAFYVSLLVWGIGIVNKLRREFAARTDFLAQVFPATAAILGAIAVGDMFVDFLKFELRFWFIAILMLLATMKPSADAPIRNRDVSALRQTSA